MPTSTLRITVTHSFPVRAETGEVRNIVCSEEHYSAGSYSFPTGSKSYQFENGEHAATIRDMFLDGAGIIYGRITE